ncbi:MAG: hypothetical protein FNT29_10915 [Halothiobacillaceae bacterium]|nr:MAG: hypothetical protein FNT29_10915 [Halothiobacillaceae bacterium]
MSSPQKHADIVFMHDRPGQLAYFERLASRLPPSSRVVDIRSMGKRGSPHPLKTETVADLGKIVDVRLKQQLNGKPFWLNGILWPYRQYKWLQAKRLFGTCISVLSDLRPAAVGVWNGQKFFSAVVALAARHLGIQVLYFENGVLPGTTTVDPKGVNIANSVPRSPSLYRNHPLSEKQAALPSLVARKPKVGKRLRSTTTALPTKYVLVPFQVDTDTQVVIHSPWISNMRQFFYEMIHVSRLWHDRELHIVFREHPSSGRSYIDLHNTAQAMPRVHFINDRPLQEMIEHATAVVTINSTVGIEGLMLGRPVITLGEAFYNIDDLVLHASNSAELVAAVNGLADFTIDEQLRQGFLAYLHDDYAVPGSWKDASPEHLNHMAARIIELTRIESGLSPCNPS